MSETAVADTIRRKLNEQFAPTVLQIENQSHLHGTSSNDSHFKLVMVSAAFEQRRPVQRHRAVYQCLATELADSVHALALHLYTDSEWQQAQVPDSPQCLGGSKLD